MQFLMDNDCKSLADLISSLTLKNWISEVIEVIDFSRNFFLCESHKQILRKLLAFQYILHKMFLFSLGKNTSACYITTVCGAV